MYIDLINKEFKQIKYQYNLKKSLTRLFLIITILVLLYPTITFSYNFLDEEKIKYDIQYLQQSNHANPNQKAIIDFLQSALHFINASKLSTDKIKEYQQIIDNFSYTTQQLREEYNNTYEHPVQVNKNLSTHTLKQKILQIHNQLINLSEQLKQEEHHIHSIHESLKLLPQQQIAIKKKLSCLEQTIFVKNISTPLECAKFTAFQAEQSANRLKIVELEFAQLSASNRKELSKLRITLLKKKYDYLENTLQMLRNQLHYLHHQKANQAITDTEKILSKQNNLLPQSIKNQLQVNYDLSFILLQQTYCMNDIASKKKKLDAHILQVQQTLSNLVEQSQWVNKSSALGETLRSQVSKLPKISKFHQLDKNMAQLRAKRLQYENHINKLPTLLDHSKQDDGTALTSLQKHILEKQLNIQRHLISLLLNNYDTQILELTKLKLSYAQLHDILQEIQQATHRYLFWIADLNPISRSYPTDVYQDILKLISNNRIHHQIKCIYYKIYSRPKTLILITLYLTIFIVLYFNINQRYYNFLKKSSTYIGKVNQDNFLITFNNIWSSILIGLPIPILWIFIGYNLNHAWSYPIAMSIGDGMYATFFILWISIVSAHFASSKGLFIAHLGWSKHRIQYVFSKHYFWIIIVIIFLATALTVFNTYNNREFSNTLGRLCFIFLCIYTTYITNNLKRTGLLLIYLNKYNSFNNLINCFLWNIMIAAPIIAIIACTFGYLFTAQALLIRLEISLFIWIVSFIVYHVIQRWIFIQKRRFLFEKIKKKRTTQLTLDTHNQPDYSPEPNYTKKIIPHENIKKILNFNTISTQSLQLIRSLITLIALLVMTLLWSELSSAFSFLENITLWDVTSTIKGIENIQPITLNTLIIVIVIIIITTITVRNLPAFLELILLQHLNLTPGTSYAVTILTKYILISLGGLIGFSLIGIEWAKIQWLIAALGVGLGFGLQEIFANFISGLIILFEKPIRIGDTITIKNFTGNITKINTRTTIITDWDHKEVIVPNKEFITKQFTNWSLSDKITRVNLRIPAPLELNTKDMIRILTQIIQNIPIALDQPIPEIYLINLQHGFPIFEIRVYTSDIKLRVPLCHQINIGIMEYYKKNKLQIPYLPTIYHYKDSIFNNLYTYTDNSESTKSSS